MARDETVRRSRSGLAKWWRCLAVGVGSAAAAFLGHAREEILELGALLGSENLADLVVALLTNLLKLWIHLLVHGVETVLHIRQDLPDLLLLIGSEIEFRGQAGNRARRVWPRLYLQLRAGAEHAPVGDRMSDSAERDSQNKYQRDQRQGLAVAGTKRH